MIRICCSKIRFWFRYIRKILDKIEQNFKKVKYILKFDLVKLIPCYILSCPSTRQVCAKLMTEYDWLKYINIFPSLPSSGKKEKYYVYSEGPELTDSPLFCSLSICLLSLQVSKRCQDFSVLPPNWNGARNSPAVCISDVY